MLKEKVIDINYLREPNKDLHLYFKKGNKIVLIDYVGIESNKGHSLTNLKRSHEIISKYPEQVIILKNTSKIINITGKKSKNVRKILIDKEQTLFYPKFCNVIYNIENPANSGYIKDLNRKSNIANSFLNSRDIFTKKILESIDRYKNEFTREELRILRNNQVYNKELIEKIIKNIFLLSIILMEKFNIVIKDFNNAKGNYIFRYCAATFFLIVDWIAEDGYKSLKLSKLQNDIIDMSYVTYGTYFDGVLSHDKKIIKIYELLFEFMTNI